MSLTVGTRLGHYEILEPLASGGMGEVFVARDHHLDRTVAVKVLPDSVATSEEARTRFRREAKTLGGISHPNILTIHDFASQGETFFAVTELLEGETLQERLRRGGTLPLDEVLRIAGGVARGLAAAHRQHIVHRDIKPANLFLQSDAGVKILDFGLARSGAEAMVRGAEDETLAAATSPGSVLGTYGYMSPEQARGLPADARSDVFSFGCVLYEMLSGASPFARGTSSDSLAAILQEDPAPLRERRPELPSALYGLVAGCLEKEPEKRPASAEQVAAALEGLGEEQRRRQQPGRRIAVLTTGTVAVVVAILLGMLLYRQSRERRARQEILPEIQRLVEAEEYYAAVARAEEVESLIPEDPVLTELVERATVPFALDSEPAGASVAIRPYVDREAAWKELGTTPLAALRLPIGAYRMRVALASYETREHALALATPPLSWASFPEWERQYQGHPANLRRLELASEGAVPEGMLPVEGGEYFPNVATAPIRRVVLGRYLIDRTEVTNQQYRDFVDAGGYEDPSYWPQTFELDGRTIPFREAVERFRDSTGRPGPATWVLGRPPEGREGHPVAGVSWYEAAAYASYRGKSLPTLYHWMRAAVASSESWAPLAHLMVAQSNFDDAGSEPVASRRGLGLMGTHDQAGNVAEWTSTAFGDRRYTLGGSYSDQPYSFNQPFPRSPWERPADTGFRGVVYVEEPAPAVLASLEPYRQDLTAIPPLSDQAFETLQQVARYQRRPTSPDVEPFEERPWGRQQWVTIDGFDGSERLPIRLHLPASGAGPFPVLVYVPGLWCASAPALRGTTLPKDFRFLVEEGYALVEPTYAGTFERNLDGRTLERIFSTEEALNLFRHWQRDVSRTLDYLEEREDLDAARVGYLGFSLGAVISGYVLPFEERIATALLLAGGFSTEIDQTGIERLGGLLQRVTVPTLMLGTAWDSLFPPETRQRSFFDYLGTPEDRKRLVIYPVGGHGALPQTELIKESLGWLDRYLAGNDGVAPSASARRPRAWEPEGANSLHQGSARGARRRRG